MPVTRRWLSVLLLALAFGISSSVVWAASDSSSSSSSAPAEDTRYIKAKAAVGARDYRAHIPLLERVTKGVGRPSYRVTGYTSAGAV